LKLSRYDDDEEEEEARPKSNVEHKEPPSDSTPKNDMSPTSEESYAINEEEPLPSDQMNNLYMYQDKGTNTSHIIHQTTCSLIYPMV